MKVGRRRHVSSDRVVERGAGVRWRVHGDDVAGISIFFFRVRINVVVVVVDVLSHGRDGAGQTDA